MSKYVATKERFLKDHWIVVMMIDGCDNSWSLGEVVRYQHDVDGIWYFRPPSIGMGAMRPFEVRGLAALLTKMETLDKDCPEEVIVEL